MENTGERLEDVVLADASDALLVDRKIFELGRLKRSSLTVTGCDAAAEGLLLLSRVCLHFRLRPAIPVVNSQRPFHGLRKV